MAPSLSHHVIRLTISTCPFPSTPSPCLLRHHPATLLPQHPLASLSHTFTLPNILYNAPVCQSSNTGNNLYRAVSTFPKHDFVFVQNTLEKGRNPANHTAYVQRRHGKKSSSVASSKMNWNESGGFETIGKYALFSTRGFDLKVGHFLKIVFLTIRMVRLQAKPHTLIIIQHQAPTSTASEEESDCYV